MPGPLLSEHQTPWLTDEREQWLMSVGAWVASVLGASPERIESVKERPWGATLRVHARAATLYFKAVGPRGRHETHLLTDIGARRPHLAPDVIAADHDRGWLLMHDHGIAMADVVDVHTQVTLLESILPAYADLQRVTADLVPSWLALGTPDRSVRRLPDLLDDLLAGRGRSGPLPIDDDERARYSGAMASLIRVCGDLATTAVPDGIDHADIHGTNVLVNDGAVRLIDWGDACVTHPYSSLMVPLWHVVARLPVGDRTHATERLRAAYLEAWGAHGDASALDDAIWIAYVARAISNDQQCAGGSAADVLDGHREIIDLLRTWHATSRA